MRVLRFQLRVHVLIFQVLRTQVKGRVQVTRTTPPDNYLHFSFISFYSFSLPREHYDLSLLKNVVTFLLEYCHRKRLDHGFFGGKGVAKVTVTSVIQDGYG